MLTGRCVYKFMRVLRDDTPDGQRISVKVFCLLLGRLQDTALEKVLEVCLLSQTGPLLYVPSFSSLAN